MTGSHRESEDRVSSESLFRRAFKRASGEWAQVLYMRLAAAGLTALGVLLTFNDWFLEFAGRFTDHPQILPITLLVPYVYMIFQVVLWRLDRDDDAMEEKRRFAARRGEVAQRRLERKTVVDAFKRSVEDLPNHGKQSAARAVSDWIATERDPTIEVMILAYSSETLLDDILLVAERMRERLHAGIAPPEMITFKLLTRDPHATWRLPCLSIREADETYRRGLDSRFGQYLSRWHVELPKAFEFLPGDRVALDVRWYPFEPMYKAAIVNRKVGLVGVYDIHEVQEHGVAGWDYHGRGVNMYEVRAAGTSARSRRALESFTALFDEIWTQHSRSVGPA